MSVIGPEVDVESLHSSTVDWAFTGAVHLFPLQENKADVAVVVAAALSAGASRRMHVSITGLR